MSEPKEIYVKVVELAFAKPEFDFLMAHKEFMAALKECKSTDDIERVCAMGQWLLDTSPKFNILRAGQTKKSETNESPARD